MCVCVLQMLRCRNSIWGKKRKRQELYGSVCNVIGKYSHHCILIAPPLSLFPYPFPYLLPFYPLPTPYPLHLHSGTQVACSIGRREQRSGRRRHHRAPGREHGGRPVRPRALQTAGDRSGDSILCHRAAGGGTVGGQEKDALDLPFDAGDLVLCKACTSITTA